MRSRLVTLVGFAAFLWSAISAPNAPSASACSCGPPPPLVSFEGTALTQEKAVEAGFGTDYDFRVERVIEGDVRPTERVRVISGSGSTCGIGPDLLRRGRYRINASPSQLPSGRRLLNVNFCSGNAQLLAAPPGDRSSQTNRWLLVGAAALATGTAGAVLSRRRHRPPA
jgi:hypothetical protein